MYTLKNACLYLGMSILLGPYLQLPFMCTSNDSIINRTVFTGIVQARDIL